ncbi:hypothetical protein ACI79G_09440 [Geodermatophilus sp. SYSU D00779]
MGDAGGATDVAFLGSSMYALTSMVSEDVGGTEVTGVLRVEDDACEVVADIGAWTMENPPPPDFDFFVPTGVPYATEAYEGGFLVTDGHANRLLQVTLVASGGRLLVDVETGRDALYALAQGDFPEGALEGSPALPDTGQLLVANRDGGFDVVAAGLDRPTSMEVVHGNAYVVTYDGEVWRIEDLPGGRHR